jgi:hypothetical protein
VTSSPPPPARADLAIVAGVGLGVAVRAVDMVSCRSLNLDEARLAINLAARSWIGLLAPLDMDQSAPPLFLWGQHLMLELFGYGDCALRLLPGLAGIAAALLMYPLARRFLEPAEARLAALVAIFSPLLINYSSAVKQYSVELLVAMAFLLLGERVLRDPTRPSRAGALLLAGVVAPWLSLTSIFVLAACWAYLLALSFGGDLRMRRLFAAATGLWGLSCGAAYLLVYRAASHNAYMRRFWELAVLSPTRPGFGQRAWKTAEDVVWGFVSGDPLVERAPYIVPLRAGTVVLMALCVVGAVRLRRERGGGAAWWLGGPVLLAAAASLAGAFPIAPRLILFAFPALIVLEVAGAGWAFARLGPAGHRAALVAAIVLVVLPLELASVVRTLALEPPGYFAQLVKDVRRERKASEPVYVFARSLPAWIYYSTDWSAPDTARLRYLVRLAGAGGAGFENTPARGRVRQADLNGLTYTRDGDVELLGLPSGMEWREVEGHVAEHPDSGWAELEAERIERAAYPGVWVLASTFYAPETTLFARLEHDAARRTASRIRAGSALVRYEFHQATAQAPAP